jgi:ADP-ribosylation factor related protein 1
MFSLVSGFYKQWTQRTQFNLLVLGSASVGKTQFCITLKQKCNSINNNEAKSNTSHTLSTTPAVLQPTVGLNTVKFMFDGCDVMLWDLGGAEELQTIWNGYYADCHAVIFLVNYDETDENVIRKDVSILENIASDTVLQSVPMMIIVNWRGQQRVENKSFEKCFMNEIQRVINMRMDHFPVFLKEANVATGGGIIECFQHLISFLKENGRSVNQNDFI